MYPYVHACAYASFSLIIERINIFAVLLETTIGCPELYSGVSDGAERGAFSLIALDPLSAAPRLTIGMEEFTVYDYHPLRYHRLLVFVT